MMIRKLQSILLFGLMLILSLMCSFVLSMPKAFGTLQFEDGKIKVDVYVIALEGIGASGVGNVSRVIEGIEAAVNNVNNENYSVGWPTTESEYGYYLNVSSYIYYDYGGGLQWTHLKTEFPVNATVHLVKDWGLYRSIVENQHECIVVNVHGEILPVPGVYSREAWVDEVAEALLYRNLTWVHVAGYPFYYAWYQGAIGKATWGEAGFQQLMKHIDKPNITIQHPSVDYTVAGFGGGAKQYWMRTWSAIHEAQAASIDYPLLDSDFDGYIALPIWKIDKYDVGAVVAFKKTANDTSCGFYVHIGTSQTFRSVLEGGGWEPTDADLYRGYIGCVASLWSLVSRTGRETLIAEAEALIEKALGEDRTEGLSKANEFLESAKYFNSRYADAEFLRDIYYTMVAATKAEKPEPNSLSQLLLMSLGVGSVVIIGAVVWHKRRKENDEEG